MGMANMFLDSQRIKIWKKQRDRLKTMGLMDRLYLWLIMLFCGARRWAKFEEEEEKELAQKQTVPGGNNRKTNPRKTCCVAVGVVAVAGIFAAVCFFFVAVFVFVLRPSNGLSAA